MIFRWVVAGATAGSAGVARGTEHSHGAMGYEGVMTAARVAVAEDEDRRADAFDVRRTVFVEEQGVEEDLEYDEHDEPDSGAAHFVAYADGEDGEPIGAARLRAYEEPNEEGGHDGGDVGKVERVAVLESHRGTGVGRALMDAVEAQARERGLTTIKLHSQTHAAGFYRNLGYERYGEEFEEAGIPHVEMRKSVAAD